MLLLQRQFPSIGNTPVSSSGVNKKPAVDTADPQSLNKYQIPSSTSPLSTDSSPSPPSAHEDNNSPGGSSNRKRSVSAAEEEHHKRKASADDFDDEIGQPSAKNQHTDRSRKNSLTRRKSSGGERGPDETRLLKRKEQNRAAQRAFRERKEKHVKDLEDKVAQLEAKTETQAAENENLRDMLGRLQNENTILKQTSFTFSVPSSSSAGPSDLTRPPTHSSSGSISMFNGSNADASPSNLPSTSSNLSTSSSNRDSSSTLFDQFDDFSALNASTSTSSATQPGGGINVTSTLSAADLDTMALFGSTGPFTTISSNPMYTSYRDPIQSMNAFASFGGWDGDITMNGTLNGTVATTANGSTLDDLFGDQLSGLSPLHQDFLTGTGDAKASPSSASPGTGISPGGAHSDCPKTKADVERMIAHGPKGTFGSLPMTHSDIGSPSGSATSVGPGVNDYDTAFQEELGNAAAKPVPTEPYNIDDLCIEMQRKARCTMQQHC